jgi:hypothetical protein
LFPEIGNIADAVTRSSPENTDVDNRVELQGFAVTEGAILNPNRSAIGQSSRTGDHLLPRFICLVLVLVLAIVSIASYLQWSVVIDLWPWQDQAMTYRFAAAYLLAFAGSLLWVVITGEMAALTGVAIIVGVNATGMAGFLAIYSVRHDTTELIVHVTGMIAILLAGMYTYRWSRHLKPRDNTPTPRLVRAAMVIFPIILFIASVRLIAQSTNVFPWDPQPQWSTIIGLCLMGSVAYFLYGAVKGTWTHAGGQFSGFLVYDLVLIPPYVRMLRAEETPAVVSASGFATYGAGGAGVNDGPLYIFLTAIGISLVISIWYLFFDRRTRMFARELK